MLLKTDDETNQEGLLCLLALFFVFERAWYEQLQVVVICELAIRRGKFDCYLYGKKRWRQNSCRYNTHKMNMKSLYRSHYFL